MTRRKGRANDTSQQSIIHFPSDVRKLAQSMNGHPYHQQHKYVVGANLNLGLASLRCLESFFDPMYWLAASQPILGEPKITHYMACCPRIAETTNTGLHSWYLCSLERLRKTQRAKARAKL